MNTSSAALATSIPTNRLTSSIFHPPQRGSPRLAIRDFLPRQPFGLSAVGEATTSAARRDSSPKAAPVCRLTNFDSSIKSATYKAAEKAGLGVRLSSTAILLTDGGCKECGLKPPAVRFCSEFDLVHHTAAMVLCRCGQQISHAHQIVSRQRKGEHPADPGDSAMTSFAQPGHGF